MSIKYGDDGFDPKALFDLDDKDSDGSDNEILRKYKKKSNGPN